MPRTRFPFFALLALVATLATGCTEQLESGGTCPALCPEQGVNVETVVVSPVVLDTTLTGLVPRGTEQYLLLAVRGDTLETRAVLRYDSLFTRTRRVGSDTTTFPIVKVDSAYVQASVDTTSLLGAESITIDAYNVDTSGVLDTAAAPIVALFRPDRLIGTATFSRRALTDSLPRDSLRIPIDTAFVRASLAAPGRIRIGLALRATGGSVQVRLGSVESVFGTPARRPATLSYRAASPDTGVMQLVRVGLTSETPNSDVTLNDQFVDVTLPVIVPPATDPMSLAVGGVPGRRTYFRFELPANIVDSATVTRATLVLTQRPNRLSADQDDSLNVYPALVLAGAEITDPVRAATIVLRGGFFDDSIRVAPSDSGEVRLDVTTALRAWRGLDPAVTPRAIVLVTPLEGATPREVLFHSANDADPLVRPRLRISYVPRVGFGQP